MIEKLPIVPLKLNAALELSKKLDLFPLGYRISKLLPNLETTLIQSGMGLKNVEYMSIALFTSFFYFILINVLSLLFFFMKLVPSTIFFTSLLISTGFSLFVIFYLILYPNLIISRKIKDIEKNLLFALRHLLIQVRSGVNLFDSMTSVSKANYGKISDEFQEAVKKAATGEFIADVLEELAFKNPSLYFRRGIWQISNALRSGGDVAKTLESLITHLESEQRVMIRNYGSQLNPLAFVYMMFGVIIPSLGITFLIVLSSFLSIPITKIYFWIILAILAFCQFFFIGFVKSKRPSVEIYV